jgi:hypothetical protein
MYSTVNHSRKHDQVDDRKRRLYEVLASMLVCCAPLKKDTHERHFILLSAYKYLESGVQVHLKVLFVYYL